MNAADVFISHTTADDATVADIRVKMKDLAGEGRVRNNNLADTLIKLEHYDEARDELRRAIECAKAFGHAAQPWKTWAILCNLERAAGDANAAAEARRKAVEAYLAHRRAGGENQNPSAQLYAATDESVVLNFSVVSSHILIVEPLSRILTDTVCPPVNCPAWARNVSAPSTMA